MKGSRVQAIIRELRGEKIDIVEWSEDPITFVTNAISPARVQRVTIMDDVEKIIEVVVEEAQLSLAIGKKGQNVRLAAKLVGWRIDIKSEEEKRAEVEAQFAGLESSDESTTLKLNVDDEQVRKLSDASLDTADRLLEATATQIAEVIGSDEVAAKEIQAAVREQVEAAERAAAEAAEREATEEGQASDPLETSDESGTPKSDELGIEPPSETSPEAPSSDEQSKDSN